MSSFSVLHWVITLAIVLALWAALRGLFARKAAVVVCTTCGHHAAAVVRTRGSFAIELVLWLCFIIPGLVYSLWRLTTRANVCASCASTTLVAPESPVGRKLLAAQHVDAGNSPTR